jgi:hypothetical protein
MGELTGHVVRDRPSRIVVEAGLRALEVTPGVPRGLQPGRATAVHAPGTDEITYWLVPGLVDDRLAAIARVLADGRIATIAAIKPPQSDCDVAAAVTGLSATQARRTINAVRLEQPGFSVSDPILVHDGPVGREAWLSVLTRDGRPAEWIFATLGGIYRRDAGTQAAGMTP